MSNLIISNQVISQHNGLFSLNDLHRASGAEKKHQPALFFRNAEVQELISEIERSTNSQNGEKSGVLAYHTIKGGNTKTIKQGTYACRGLVIRYGMWISPKFSLMVIRAFDALNTGAIPCLGEPATKSDRKPLVQAVNMLVAETGVIYSNVWKMIHQRFDVECVDELTCEQVNQAIAYVHGLILEHGSKSRALSPELTKLLAISIETGIEHARILQRVNLYGDNAIYNKIDQIRKHTHNLVQYANAHAKQPVFVNGCLSVGLTRVVYELPALKFMGLVDY